MADYIPHSPEETQAMLTTLGVSSLRELYPFTPDQVDIGLEGKNEQEIIRYFDQIAQKNCVYRLFLRSAGASTRYVPSVVQSLSQKASFLTAYTPYQPEMSQGLLQLFFEYQSCMCRLLEMDVSNAGVYSGGTALGDALIMACQKKKKVLVSSAVAPHFTRVAKRYVESAGIELVFIGQKGYTTDLSEIRHHLDETVAAVVIQQPNYFGTIEDALAVGEIAKTAGVEFIMLVNPLASSLLKPPGECGATIACGDLQPLGLALNAGGPYAGFLLTTKEKMRQLPGRIVGRTHDARGKEAYTLILQTREQHIRREKASSSICTNHAHCVVAATTYLLSFGKQGLREVADACVSNAHYLAQELSKSGFEVLNKGEFFDEFVTTDAQMDQKLLQVLHNHGVLGPLPLTDNRLLWHANECLFKEDIDFIVSLIRDTVKGGAS